MAKTGAEGRKDSANDVIFSCECAPFVPAHPGWTLEDEKAFIIQHSDPTAIAWFKPILNVSDVVQ